MSRFWPHTALADDQPQAHTILYTHTLTRGLTAGTIVGSALALPIFALRRFNVLSTPARSLPLTFSRVLMRSSATGAVVGTLLLIPMTTGRMWGREEIEWQDRAWRLLENKGQVEVDDWTYTGMLGGALAGSRLPGWKPKFGAVGWGSVAGMMGYMAWRHGIKGGKFEEKEP